MILRDINPLKGFCWEKVKDIEYITPERFNEIIKDLEKSDLREIDLQNYKNWRIKYIRISNSWQVIEGSRRKEIRVNKVISRYDVDGVRLLEVEFHRYTWLADKLMLSDHESTEEKSGKYYYDTLEERFNEVNGTKTLALESLFSGRKYKKEYKEIKKLVPTQISFINPFYTKKKLGSKYNTKPVYKADVSSAFSSQIMKDLPTLHECKQVSGRVDPTEEYPFAFYIKSKHIKCFDGYDSHELNSIWFKEYYKCDDSVDPKDDETILCKKMPAKYYDALKKTFQYFYDHRKEEADNKTVMNATIGYFHRNNNPALSMLAAIIILRCNIDMIRRCKQLTKEGNTVLFIATDSIAWLGKLSSAATDEKRLGTFTYEGKDIQFLGISPKAYQWLDNNGNCTTKYSGIAKSESAKLSFGDLLNYNGVTRRYYQFNKKELQFFESALV